MSDFKVKMHQIGFQRGWEGKGSVATLRPAAVSRACEYVGSKATSSTNVLYDVSPSSS